MEVRDGLGSRSVGRRGVRLFVTGSRRLALRGLWVASRPVPKDPRAEMESRWNGDWKGSWDRQDQGLEVRVLWGSGCLVRAGAVVWMLRAEGLVVDVEAEGLRWQGLLGGGLVMRNLVWRLDLQTLPSS